MHEENVHILSKSEISTLRAAQYDQLMMSGICLGLAQCVIHCVQSLEGGESQFEWSSLCFVFLSGVMLSFLLWVIAAFCSVLFMGLTQGKWIFEIRIAPWLFLSIIHLWYLGSDLKGVSFKLSLALGLESESQLIHYALLSPIAFSIPIVMYLAEKMRGIQPFQPNHTSNSNHTRLPKGTLTLTISLFICTAISLNELTLEGAYYGLHFWFSSTSLFGLYLLSSLYSSSLQQTNECGISTEKECSVRSTAWRKRALLSACLGLSFWVSVDSLSQNARQRLHQQDTAFALKLWGTMNSYFEDLMSDDGRSTAQSEESVSSMYSHSRMMRRGHGLNVNFGNQGQSTAIVILLTIDSLASERFTHYPLATELSTLASLNKNPKAWFNSHLFTASTSTRFTLGSMIFGRYPSHLHWTRDQATHPSLVSEPKLTLWEKLGQKKISSTYIATVSDVIRRSNGLARGISEIIELPPKRDQSVAFSPQVITALLPRLERATKSPQGSIFFSHLLDAHHPFDGGRIRTGSPSRRQLSEFEVIDQELKRLIEWIETQKNKDRFWLIISSDHGQGFGRHHVRTHNGPPYEHQARVPLWVYYGGASAKNRPEKTLWEEARYWSSIDIHATLIELFGLSLSEEEQALSWWPYWSAMLPQNDTNRAPLIERLSAARDVLMTRPLLSLNWYTRALYLPGSGQKLIEDTRSKTVALFSISNDPQERSNLCDQSRAHCDELRKQLVTLIREGGGRQPISSSRHN